MSKRYYRLKTTTGEHLEIGTRIRQEGAPLFGPQMQTIEGVITKMEECDSGIFVHVKCDNGTLNKAHVRYDIPYGVVMHNHGILTTILRQVPSQIEISALAINSGYA